MLIKQNVVGLNFVINSRVVDSVCLIVMTMFIYLFGIFNIRII